MTVKEKLFMELSALDEHGPITIVAFGDSVTHGSVGAGEMDYETVYWNRLRRKLNEVRDTIPVNVINAGIGGTTAARSVARLESQVLCHRPDRVIVCFGLNDINGTLEAYLDALRVIFERCRESGTQVSSCPRFLWQAGYVGHTNEGAEHSWRKEKFGDPIP